MKKIQELITSIATLDRIGNKESVKNEVVKKFHLTKDRSVFYCDEFAIRFSYTSGKTV